MLFDVFREHLSRWSYIETTPRVWSPIFHFQDGLCVTLQTGNDNEQILPLDDNERREQRFFQV